ncbi:hypothetical protein ES705_38409 [subsurface metagenome]
MSLAGLSDIYDVLDNTLESIASYVHLAADSIQLAGTTLADEGHDYAGTKLVMAHNHLEFAARKIGYGTSESHRLSVKIPEAFELIDTNWPSEVEVTMDAILSAMITAEFDELQKFVGLIDAYRVAIWNAPFNANFYAALARGFQTWP